MLLWSYDVTKKKSPTAYRIMLTALCHFDGLKNSEVGRHNAMFSKRTFSIKSQESRVKNAKKKSILILLKIL
ncbi:hypothetical protein JoomaDRAFT_3150 [Galbibacter orientalis DSM 19592]|uniref:Uncharacterized protein n=1 Tax=Galbibacter orientalis DSM 19592 TaxID=926559 RepID=I3C5F4_9FLAO|nr:hypothetical protein JoomaDRAFT_1848 [Galbibacter orientalis DSM 19592]EIJ40097.1 hypothetical protein JoomaDRAFT_3150 [Galbibacter orientalis DSM 19592]